MNSSTLSSTDKQQNGMDLTFLLSCAVLPLVVAPKNPLQLFVLWLKLEIVFSRREICTK